jgi:hypothetical protein
VFASRNGFVNALLADNDEDDEDEDEDGLAYNEGRNVKGSWISSRVDFLISPIGFISLPLLLLLLRLRLPLPALAIELPPMLFLPVVVPPLTAAAAAEVELAPMPSPLSSLLPRYLSRSSIICWLLGFNLVAVLSKASRFFSIATSRILAFCSYI